MRSIQAAQQEAAALAHFQQSGTWPAGFTPSQHLLQERHRFNFNCPSTATAVHSFFFSFVAAPHPFAGRNVLKDEDLAANKVPLEGSRPAAHVSNSGSCSSKRRDEGQVQLGARAAQREAIREELAEDGAEGGPRVPLRSLLCQRRGRQNVFSLSLSSLLALLNTYAYRTDGRKDR